MKNQQLKKQINIQGKSLYRISKDTGIPYTTINELANGKLDIDRCSLSTVYRLACEFSCRIEEIMNPIQLVDGMSGRYRKIRYHWISNGDISELHIEDDGTDKVIDKGDYSQERFACAYKSLTECLIDIYLSDKETEAMLSEA